MKINSIINKITKFLGLIHKYRLNSNSPKYRIVEIFQDEDDTYKTMLQVANKNITFYAKPEEILADDHFVDCLSPRDVRTLTYLGYLSINQPQYKILAQRLSETSEVFVVKKRGHKKPIIKTVAEIAKEANMITSMNPNDAKAIGYAIANSELKQEKLEKDEIQKLLNK